MRIPANSFDRADLALCHAHGDAVHDHYPMPPFTTAEVSHFKTAFAYRAVINAFEVGAHMPADLPLPPSYWDDLEHWLETLAPAAGLRHMVCVRSSIGASVGRVFDKQTHKLALEMIASNARAGSDYRLCDAAGWIPHVPTASSVCPVPNGVTYESRLVNGRVGYCGDYWGDLTGIDWYIVAWRPTGSAA